MVGDEPGAHERPVAVDPGRARADLRLCGGNGGLPLCLCGARGGGVCLGGRGRPDREAAEGYRRRARRAPAEADPGIRPQADIDP